MTQSANPLGELRLEMRTPAELLYTGDVQRIRAEDLDGWFGILPGRPDLLAVLPAGLLVFEDDEGEAYVANGGGVLNLERGHCRVALHSAILTRTSAGLTEALEQSHQVRERQLSTQTQVVDVLIHEALQRTTQDDPQLWSRRR